MCALAGRCLAARCRFVPIDPNQTDPSQTRTHPTVCPFKTPSQHQLTDRLTTHTPTRRTHTEMRLFEPQDQQPRRGGRRRLRSPRRARTLLFAAFVGLALLGSLALLLGGRGVAAAAAAVAPEAEEDGGSVAVFVPTREWQVIPEGAAIPPVRFVGVVWSDVGGWRTPCVVWMHVPAPATDKDPPTPPASNITFHRCNS